MCSSGSTNKRRLAPLAGRALVMAALMLALGGCAGGGGGAARPTFVHGYARLDVLVRRHPGWVGLARYDGALARLAQAAGRPPASAPPDTGLAGLPAAPAGATAAPALALDGERRRLEAVQRVQVARLWRRQAQNRRRQIALETPVWRRQAAAEYARAAAAAQSAYAQRLTSLASDADARGLNLTLQIKALQRIVSGWKLSAPPTPDLNRARTELLQKQDQLAALDRDRRRSSAQAAAARDAALAAAARDRAASVLTLTASEEARLRGQDDLQATALQGRLAQQQATLLREERSLSVAPVAPAGGLTAQKLPPGPTPETEARGAGHSFRLAQAQLQAQRDRWRAFLYSDTRAAVLDAATRQHWVVTFDRPAPGERDLTALLAQALTARVWKT